MELMLAKGRHQLEKGKKIQQGHNYQSLKYQKLQFMRGHNLLWMTYNKVLNSPKSTMITLANACPQPNTMMIKLENAFVTVMTMLSSRRLHICHKQKINH